MHDRPVPEEALLAEELARARRIVEKIG